MEQNRMPCTNKEYLLFVRAACDSSAASLYKKSQNNVRTDLEQCIVNKHVLKFNLCPCKVL